MGATAAWCACCGKVTVDCNCPPCGAPDRDGRLTCGRKLHHQGKHATKHPFSQHLWTSWEESGKDILIELGMKKAGE